jgi:hypothetical protein
VWGDEERRREGSQRGEKEVWEEEEERRKCGRKERNKGRRESVGVVKGGT